MAKEASVGWPMLRERIELLCGKTHDGLRNETVLSAPTDVAMAQRVADIINKRASWLLESLSRA